MGKITKRTLGVIEFVKTIFIDEMELIIKREGAAYLKFIILLQGIEFLGACYDDKDFEKRGESEVRFNTGLAKLGEKYLKYTNKSHPQYFYNFFRCPMIHQFKHDQRKITLATENSIYFNNWHLTLNEDGQLYVVLEPFYRDLKDAAQKLILEIESGENRIVKLKNPFLTLHTIDGLQIVTS